MEYIKIYNLFISTFTMELVALLSSDNGTWAQVAGLIRKGDWDNILLIGDDSVSKLEVSQPHEFIKVNLNGKITEVKEEILKKLKGKIKGTEVALSIASGSGKEHMAVISSLLSVPVGIRFSVLTRDGIIYL